MYDKRREANFVFTYLFQNEVREQLSQVWYVNVLSLAEIMMDKSRVFHMKGPTYSLRVVMGGNSDLPQLCLNTTCSWNNARLLSGKIHVCKYILPLLL